MLTDVPRKWAFHSDYGASGSDFDGTGRWHTVIFGQDASTCLLRIGYDVVTGNV